MDCPTTVSANFIRPTATGFRDALNNTFTADPGNAVNVAQFWQGVRLMSANTRTSAIDSATAGTRADLLSNTNAIAGLIAPLSNGTNFAATPAGYANVLAQYDLYDNTSTTLTQLVQNPNVFPPGFFCPG